MPVNTNISPAAMQEGENVTVLVDGGTISGKYKGHDTGLLIQIGGWKVNPHHVTAWAYTDDIDTDADAR